MKYALIINVEETADGDGDKTNVLILTPGLDMDIPVGPAIALEMLGVATRWAQNALVEARVREKEREKENERTAEPVPANPTE